MSTITLNLPDKTIQQAQQAATALKRPLEEVLTDMLTAVLPATTDIPAHLQLELTHMTWLDTPTLWEIASSTMTPSDQANLQTLSQQLNPTPAQVAQLDHLRQEYGRVTLRKARAYALLSLRGGKPLLNHL